MAKMPTTINRNEAPAFQGPRMPASALDSGISALAEPLARIADEENAKRARQRAEEDRLLLANAASRLRAAESERLVNEGNSLADSDLDGFDQRFAASFNENAAGQAELLPDRLRTAFLTEAAGMRDGLELRAFDVVNARKIDHQTRLLDDQIDLAGQTVFADPTQFEPTLETSRRAIIESGLPQAIKQKRWDDLTAGLASSRMIGMAKLDPDSALGELNGNQWDHVFSVAQKLDLINAVKRERDVRDKEARAMLAPLQDELINGVLDKPAAFDSTLTAFAQNPALAGLSIDGRKEEVRSFAGRLAEARLISIGQGNPWAAKLELQSGRHDAYLDPGDKTRLLVGFSNAIEEEQRRREAEAKQQEAINRAVAAVTLKDRMADDVASRQTFGKGANVSVQEVGSILGPAAATEFAIAQKEADEVWKLVAPFKSMSAAEINASLQAAKPKAGAGLVAGARRFEAAQRIAADLLERRAKDPAGASLDNPVVNAAWQKFQKQADDPKAMAAWANITREQQKLWGIPAGAQKILPAGVAQEMASRIQNADPAQRSAELRAVVEQATAWGGNAGAVMREVAAAAGGGDELAVLAPLAGDPQAMIRMSEAVGKPDVTGQLQKGVKRDLAAKVDGKLQRLYRSLAASPGGQEAISKTRDAIVRAAAADVAAGASPDAAVNKYATPYLGQYQFRDGWRAPKVWKGQEVKTSAIAQGAAAHFIALQDSDRINWPVGDPRIKGDAARKAQLQAMAANVRWITRADDGGLILVDENNQAVTMKNGEAIAPSWDELLARPAKAKPDGGALFQGTAPGGAMGR
jgi:hypothetical protein